MDGRYHCVVGLYPEGFRGTDRGVFERVPVGNMDAFMARPELTPTQIAASRDSLRRVQEMLRGRIDAESFCRPERGVFERRPVYPRDSSSQTRQPPVPLPGTVTPLTRPELERLVDNAVRRARGPVPLPIYDPSSSGYAGG